jgi:Zn-dependent M28 family amino/carboxypeptidase
VKANATGVLFVSSSLSGLYGTARGMESSGIPLLVVSRDTEALLRQPNTHVALTIDADAQRMMTWNVIAQTKTGNPDAVIVVGSHLDSVPAGPGTSSTHRSALDRR